MFMKFLSQLSIGITNQHASYLNWHPINRCQVIVRATLRLTRHVAIIIKMVTLQIDLARYFKAPAADLTSMNCHFSNALPVVVLKLLTIL